MEDSSVNVDQLATALVKAQQVMEGARKDSENPFFRSKYADLASVWLACRAPLNDNGLSVVQLPGFENGVATVTTILLHTSGQWIKGTSGAPIVGKTTKDGTVLPADAQSVGSAITYLRRYALAAVAGVVQEDDDGNAASRKARPTHQTVAEGKAGASHASGGAKEPAPAPQPLSERPKQLTEKEPMPWDGPKPPALWPAPGPKKGKPLAELTSAELVTGLAWIRRTGRYQELVEPMETLLASREGE